MTDDRYSYWLNVNNPLMTVLRPEETAAIVQSLTDLFQGALVLAGDINSPWTDIQMEVDKGVGSIPMIPNAFELLAQWAKEHPDYIVRLEEKNENDAIKHHIMTFFGEHVLRDTHARLIPADIFYDWPTVNAVAGFVEALLSNSQGASLADSIRNWYKDYCDT